MSMSVDSASCHSVVSMETPTSPHTFGASRSPGFNRILTQVKPVFFLVRSIQTTTQSAAKLAPHRPLSTPRFCLVFTLDQIFGRRKPTTTSTSLRCTPSKRPPPVVSVTFCSGNIHTFFCLPQITSSPTDRIVSNTHTLMQSRNVTFFLPFILNEVVRKDGQTFAWFPLFFFFPCAC